MHEATALLKRQGLALADLLPLPLAISTSLKCSVSEAVKPHATDLTPWLLIRCRRGRCTVKSLSHTGGQ